MKKRDALRVIVPVLLAAVVVGCDTAKGEQIRPVANVPSTITIDPNLGEIFAPPPEATAPAMTAEQAWAAYGKIDTAAGTKIPPDVSVSLGLFTLPLGPSGSNGTEAYTAHNILTYGYSWHSCPTSRNPKVKRLPASPCIEWLFLNANTGQQIDNTGQQ